MSEKEVKPWDLLNPNSSKVIDHIAKDRMSVCKSCDRFLKITGQCKECGCIMGLKTRLSNASCPIGKWEAFIE